MPVEEGLETSFWNVNTRTLSEARRSSDLKIKYKKHKHYIFFNLLDHAEPDASKYTYFPRNALAVEKKLDLLY